MTTITLEGKEYQLDIEQAKQLGLLKEKDSRVKSWEEVRIIDFIQDNMQEQIKIDIPEGKVPVMEQTENGVVITWKEKELTYNDIESKLNCSISSCGFLPNKINFTFYKKVEVIRKLTNIRNYFGKPDKNKEGWIIEQGGIRKTMFESKYCVHTTVFAKREHAEQAIKILGDELKYLFEPW